ncbi:Rib/alpha-like domain-containing protein [Corynebacterium propinquum]
MHLSVVQPAFAQPAKQEAARGETPRDETARSEMPGMPQEGQHNKNHQVTATFAAGEVTRDILIDEKRGRGWVAVDKLGESPSGITWFDLETQKPSETVYWAPSKEALVQISLSNDGKYIYALHQRDGKLTIFNADDGTVVRQISGTPKFPKSMVEDTDTGAIYIYDSKSLVYVDPNSATVSAPISVSTEKYPSINGLVYDAARKMLWISAGRENVITGYNTAAKQWVQDLAIPVAETSFHGAAVGGRPYELAYDSELGHLYVVVKPTLQDDFTESKILTLDAATGKFLGTPIEVGTKVNSLHVNPRTHEIYVAAADDNRISVVSPETWTVVEKIDFTQLGVTSGYGAGEANLAVVTGNSTGDVAYASHPYKERSRVSQLHRTGPTPAITPLQSAEDNETPPADAENSGWTGPEQAFDVTVKKPDSAVDVTEANLQWGINEYLKAWSVEALGEAVTVDNYLPSFTRAQGWVDKTTKQAHLSFGNGFRIKHYPTLAPHVITTMGNPELQVNADGSGALTMDVAWSVYEDKKSEGYKRVTVATFSASTIDIAGGDITFEATPEFYGRAYQGEEKQYPNSWPKEFIDYLSPDTRAWWYTTGASLDADKAPLPIKLTAKIPVADVPAGSDHGDNQDSATPDVKPGKTMAEEYSPTPHTSVTVAPGIVVQAEDALINTAQLPAGTTYAWKAPLDTDRPGIQTATIVVTYPDGSTDEVTTFIVVDDQPATEQSDNTLGKIFKVITGLGVMAAVFGGIIHLLNNDPGFAQLKHNVMEMLKGIGIRL